MTLDLMVLTHDMTKQLDKAFNIAPTEVVVEKTEVEPVGIHKPKT